jgi:3'(2'), 5'-bisphosphate nucleotidase
MPSSRIVADDAVLASQLAVAASHTLLEARNWGLFHDRELGRAGDAVSQAVLSQALQCQRPADAVLSEEGQDNIGRLDSARVWIIDPVDGTREYSEGREDWAVHVALVVEGAPTASVVALPQLNRLFSSAEPWVVPDVPVGPLRIAVSRTRPPEVAGRVAERLAGELVPMGSAGFKAMAVVRGAVDAYLHAGGQYEWDSAAPVGVARAHGLHASRIDGSTLRYNQPDPLLPDLLICRPERADELLSALADERDA